MELEIDSSLHVGYIWSVSEVEVRTGIERRAGNVYNWEQ